MQEDAPQQPARRAGAGTDRHAASALPGRMTASFQAVQRSQCIMPQPSHKAAANSAHDAPPRNRRTAAYPLPCALHRSAAGNFRVLRLSPSIHWHRQSFTAGSRGGLVSGTICAHRKGNFRSMAEEEGAGSESWSHRASHQMSSRFGKQSRWPMPRNGRLRLDTPDAVSRQSLRQSIDRGRRRLSSDPRAPVATAIASSVQEFFLPDVTAD